MLVSRLIQKLQETIDKEGDMFVYVYDEFNESTMPVIYGGSRDKVVAEKYYTKGDNSIVSASGNKVYILSGCMIPPTT